MDHSGRFIRKGVVEETPESLLTLVDEEIPNVDNDGYRNRVKETAAIQVAGMRCVTVCDVNVV